MSTHTSDVLYDVAIVGLGAMGSAAAWQLTRRGARVVGIDRWAPPHAHGSTHGRTRIIREAYYEHPVYVPLVQRAYAEWAALEDEGECTLFRRTGGLMVGPPDGVLVRGALRSAREHGLAHELLSASEVHARFPGFALAPEMVGVYESRAGLLFPEQCVQTMLALAARRGAALRTGERVSRWRVAGDSVEIETDRGRVRAARLILAAGPWLSTLVPELELPLEVERQLFHWFAPAAHPERYDADHSPIALWEYAPDRLFATFPDVGHGLKTGVHHEGAITTADAQRAPVSDEETVSMRALLARFCPGAAGTLLDRTTCLYTNTPDHHFLIDVHPRHPEVIVASPCSGHGFKFASAIGELLADLALTGTTTFDRSPFMLSRFARGDAARSGQSSTSVPWPPATAR